MHNGEPAHGLNGDILVWNPVTQRRHELSSMGIRVNAETLRQQLTISNQLHFLDYPYHQAIMKSDICITNWVNATDYFFAQNFNGAAFNTRGSAPVNQITFTGSSNNDTTWQSYDHQVTPAPEPSTYGALFISLGLGFAAWRRRHSHFAYALPL